jgi:putative ABC transport system permease protein
MIRNYLKIAWRNLYKSKIYSFINIGGLAVGMAVAILIGLWIYDELTYDRSHAHYNRIAQVMQHQTWNGEIGTQEANPAQMAEEIRRVFGSDFTYVLQASWNYDHTLTYGEKMFSKPGSFFEPEVPEMLSLKMVAGTRKGLTEMNSILLAKSAAESYFGHEDPIGKVLRLDNTDDVKVTGVYEDFPPNSSFNDLKFIVPWSLYLSENKWIAKMSNPWGSNYTRTFAMIAEKADMEKVSAKIRNVKLNKVSESEKRYKPVVFLHPMSKWHLYSDFKEGKNTGGAIDNVWLFGTIGFFVLVLACINFMNLSTARSEKRAKEVGIRKSVGSVRAQLITQFFSESVLIAMLAFTIAILFVALAIPSFNTVAGKHIAFPWNRFVFWIAGGAFSLLTGLFAGLYPALFLSSFRPVSVLKGTFRVGRNASLPRKVLVVLQFAISTILVIGTMIVYQQIQYAQNRPMGYNKSGLIWVGASDGVHKHLDAVRTELINAGAITDIAESGSPITNVWNTNGGFDWEGKDPSQAVDFPNNPVSVEYGKTVGWTVKEGRDFSREFASDSSAFILNEAAVAFIGLKEPLGKIIKWENKPYTVIGVVKDVILQSPYTPVRPALWHLAKDQQNVFMIKINPSAQAHDAMARIEEVFKRLNPTAPFSANFVDEEYARKFGNEKRISQLCTFFAGLAILISCLGLSGLASYVAEQRTKEIGIRKVLGASVTNLWRMLSQDFVLLVVISSVIAVPAAYYLTHRWLQQYDYRTTLSWWTFGAAVIGAVVITLLTVSFQAIKASTANPVNSLRSE